MSRSDSRPLDSRSSQFPKTDSGSSIDPIREEEESEGTSNQNKFENQRNQPKWTSSTSSWSASSDGTRGGASFYSSSSSSDTGVNNNQTSVRSISNPTVDSSGNPIIETITKTDRTIDGQPYPTETTRSSIPVEQTQQSQPSLQQQNQQQMLE